ncbi:O-demethylpuromycin-O-methyltransferase [Roseomonas mucosa]|uniref:O-demethylpuromycin-O-methyltransferase n=1 Tax=Roseomonas mucosa TaxID=207340 RepID=A0A4Y1MVG4_9PROT|nr:methyltransferase [Roseomonas mucosa]AWV21484.1 O-demethylpuromycin-O-methyltransferase [Roseomonas mucosa]MDT8277336.1 methyltransferase [Roseomonas mucosa]MDT8356466.1 methyltransferase [Roseomonas mucosa]MDU7520741.1 methyltransferase [Roseomonas mucosa]
MREAPAQALRRLINGYQASQAIHVAAMLGLADLLRDGAMGPAAAAARLGVDADALGRLLRALAALQLFREDADGTFSLAPMGEALCANAAGSCHAWARLAGRPAGWAAWGALDHSIRTGQSAFRHLHGTDAWQWRADYPEEGRIFDRAMREGSLRIAAALTRVVDVARFRHLIDIGGGDGSLLLALLRQFPALRGTVFDRPDVVIGCEAGEAAARLRILGGDFFAGVPEGGDAYILKFILHDWADADAGLILRRCVEAMRPDARLLVIERLLAPANEGPEGKLSDLNMLVNLGGRERSAEEFAALLEAAGLTMLSVTRIDAQVVVLEAARLAARRISRTPAASTDPAPQSRESPHAPRQ